LMWLIKLIGVWYSCWSRLERVLSTWIHH